MVFRYIIMKNAHLDMPLLGDAYFWIDFLLKLIVKVVNSLGIL